MSAALETSNHSFANQLKKSLFNFINKNIPSANVNDIDDILLEYMVTIFQEVSDDSCFDVDAHIEFGNGDLTSALPDGYTWDAVEFDLLNLAFIEMMGAYVPDFCTIDVGQVFTWVLEVEAELVRQQQERKGEKQEDSAEEILAASVPSLLPPPHVKNSRAHSSSESEEEEPLEHVVFEGEQYTEQVQMLREMFPNTCLMEIKHCISIACGSVDVAAATLLHRRDSGQAIAGAALPSPRTSLIDDITLKYRIIERYSYVDKNSGQKEHRPLAPKMEPKKLVRYRDNKVVSLKGEKYTEVSKTGVEEENLKKPKKHCP